MTIASGPLVSRISFAPDNEYLRVLGPLLRENAAVALEEGIPATPIASRSPGLQANAYYFGHPPWAENWLHHVHRYPELRARWLAAGGPWDDKVVIDVGCGPGNLFAVVGGRPQALVGVDVSRGALKYAAALGYTPLLADAHDLPLRSSCADIVTLNAALHHCDDMGHALAESARLVRPGGLLIADHDPQLSAFQFRLLGRWLWDLREPIYRWMRRGGHAALEDEQKWALATEIHHKPGDGVSEEMMRGILEPLGFDVQVYPHNHNVGAEILEGCMGKAPLRIRLVQRLSGIDPGTKHGAITMLVTARKRP